MEQFLLPCHSWEFRRAWAVPYDVTLQRRIRELCAQAIAARDPEELQPILCELREALRQHVERLQNMVAEYRSSPIDIGTGAPADSTHLRHKKAI